MIFKLRYIENIKGLPIVQISYFVVSKSSKFVPRILWVIYPTNNGAKILEGLIIEALVTANFVVRFDEIFHGKFLISHNSV